MIKKDNLTTWIMLYALHENLVFDSKKRIDLDMGKLIEAYNHSQEKEPLKDIISEITLMLKKREEMELSKNHLGYLLRELRIKNIKIKSKEHQAKYDGDDVCFLEEKKVKLEISVKRIDRQIEKLLIASIDHIIYFSKKSYKGSLVINYSKALDKEQIREILELGYSAYLINYLLDERNMIRSDWGELNTKKKAIHLLAKRDYRKIYFSFLLLKNLKIISLTNKEKEKNFSLIKTIYDISIFSSWYDKKTNHLTKFNLSNYRNLIKAHKEIKKIIPTQGEMKAWEIAVSSLTKKEREKLNVLKVIGCLKNKNNTSEGNYNAYKEIIQVFHDKFKRELPIMEEILNDYLPLGRIKDLNRVEEKEEVILEALLKGKKIHAKRDLRVSVLKDEERGIFYKLNKIGDQAKGGKIYENERKIMEDLLIISKETGLRFNLIKLRLAAFQLIKYNEVGVKEKNLEAIKEFILKSKKFINHSNRTLNKDWIEKDWLEYSVNKRLRIRSKKEKNKFNEQISSLEKQYDKNLSAEQIEENREIEVFLEGSLCVKQSKRGIARVCMSLNKMSSNWFPSCQGDDFSDIYPPIENDLNMRSYMSPSYQIPFNQPYQTNYYQKETKEQLERQNKTSNPRKSSVLKRQGYDENSFSESSVNQPECTKKIRSIETQQKERVKKYSVKSARKIH